MTNRIDPLCFFEDKHIGIIHKCEHCDYVASGKYSLQSHKKSQHDGVVYSCDECDYIGTQRYLVRRHKLSFH